MVLYALDADKNTYYSTNSVVQHALIFYNKTTVYYGCYENR